MKSLKNKSAVNLFSELCGLKTRVSAQNLTTSLGFSIDKTSNNFAS